VETASGHVEVPVDGRPASTPEAGDFEVPRVARRPPGRLNGAWNRTVASLANARFAIAVYLATRGLLLVVAIVNGALRHHSGPELANWDGDWYRALANHGYPTHVSHAQSTLGFFPLYPLTMWVAARPLLPIMHSSLSAITAAGVVVSGIGGLIATVLVQRLAAGWWGERTGRRAALLFCLFPGSVVFSMVYAEGLLLPLAAGCILALQRRRWLLAGVLAALATATEPEALVLVLVCALSAGLELRRRGLGDRQARKSLVAPALSVVGAAAFAGFLWAWTGTPLASFTTQRYGWKEKTDPLALVHLTKSLVHELSLRHFNHPTINLNLPVGVFGAVLLLVLLVLLARVWREVSPEALLWTLGISFLALTSEFTPPNPRLLITAFPAVIVLARYLRGRAFGVLLAVSGVLLVVMSALTFVSTTLRP
jgi:MFS family permease